MTNQQHSTGDAAEIAKFAKMAAHWWDSEGPLRTLHEINPVRMQFILSQVNVADKRVLDIGCGGGILSEALAGAGAKVTGIDLAQTLLEVARLHAHKQALDLDYQQQSAKEHARHHVDYYDVITCLELLEHVDDPGSLVQSAAQMIKPGGWVIFSTINRNCQSYLLAILGAEYVFGLLPKGTHDYEEFIKPAQLADWARQAGLVLTDLSGMRYNPVLREATLVSCVNVNYLMCCKKPIEVA